jgi:hypothetical protein
MGYHILEGDRGLKAGAGTDVGLHGHVGKGAQLDGDQRRPAAEVPLSCEHPLVVGGGAPAGRQGVVPRPAETAELLLNCARPKNIEHRDGEAPKKGGRSRRKPANHGYTMERREDEKERRRDSQRKPAPHGA